MKSNRCGKAAGIWCLAALALATVNLGCAGSLEIVDARGYHHHGYYDNHHDWHGGYYDENHAYHDDAHDWHQ